MYIDLHTSDRCVCVYKCGYIGMHIVWTHFTGTLFLWDTLGFDTRHHTKTSASQRTTINIQHQHQNGTAVWGARLCAYSPHTTLSPICVDENTKFSFSTHATDRISANILFHVKNSCHWFVEWIPGDAAVSRSCFVIPREMAENEMTTPCRFPHNPWGTTHCALPVFLHGWHPR